MAFAMCSCSNCKKYMHSTIQKENWPRFCMQTGPFLMSANKRKTPDSKQRVLYERLIFFFPKKCFHRMKHIRLLF
jgi:hypothetical protein